MEQNEFTKYLSEDYCFGVYKHLSFKTLDDFALVLASYIPTVQTSNSCTSRPDVCQCLVV